MDLNPVEIVIGVATIISTFAIVKYQGAETKKQFESHDEEQKKFEVDVFKRIEAHGEKIVALQTKQESAITAKEVSEHYLSKEHFRQFEKHIDDKFRTVIDGQGKILEEIRTLKACRS
jgi:hypothetical protein